MENHRFTTFQHFNNDNTDCKCILGLKNYCKLTLGFRTITCKLFLGRHIRSLPAMAQARCGGRQGRDYGKYDFVHLRVFSVPFVQ